MNQAMTILNLLSELIQVFADLEVGDDDLVQYSVGDDGVIKIQVLEEEV